MGQLGFLIVSTNAFLSRSKEGRERERKISTLLIIEATMEKDRWRMLEGRGNDNEINIIQNGLRDILTCIASQKKRNSKNIRLKILASSRYNFYDTRSPSIERKIYPLRKKKRKRGERWNKRNDLLGLKGNRRRNPKIEERTRHCDGNIGAEPSQGFSTRLPGRGRAYFDRDLNRIHSEWQHKRAANLPNLLHQRGTRGPLLNSGHQRSWWGKKKKKRTKQKKGKKERKRGYFHRDEKPPPSKKTRGPR